MKYSFFVILTLLMFSIDLTAQEIVSVDSMYLDAWNVAMKDQHIDSQERRFLDMVGQSRGLDSLGINAMETYLKSLHPDELDQSGRWPLVGQNMILGASIYGWAIPTALGAEDFKWYIGCTMLSLGGSFIATHKYTETMEINHARAQMMRTGTLFGLRFGFAVNQLLNFNEPYDSDWYYNNPEQDLDRIRNEKRRAVVLMTAIPVGMILGDYMYKKDKPSNGDAWTLTLGMSVSALTTRSLYNLVFKEPEQYNTTREYSGYGDYYDVRTSETDEYIRWRNIKTVVELAAYPAGYYLGLKFNQNKNYTFGDAFMLYQGYGFGFINTSNILNAFLGDNISEETLLVLASAGGIGFAKYYDSYLDNEDYSLGQSSLMALGTIAGMATGAGITAILMPESTELSQIFVTAGSVLGAYYTHSIIDVYKDGALISENSQSLKFNMTPTVFTESSSPKERMTFVPGIAMHVIF